MAAAVTVGVATMMANPLVAEAAVSPSLKNLLNSVVAGGVVLAVIAGAVTAVSNFDQVSSGEANHNRSAAAGERNQSIEKRRCGRVQPVDREALLLRRRPRPHSPCPCS